MKYTSYKDLNAIGAALSLHSPSLIIQSHYRQAAVALVLQQSGTEPEILFIQRASSDQDPWSGQIAFPGGGMEVTDASLEQAAIRETREETDILLFGEANLGRLNDLQGRTNNREIDLVISCFVFRIDQQQVLSPNYEVAEAFWIPLSTVIDQANHFEYQTSYRAEPYPAIQLGPGMGGQDRVLWGLTFRFVQGFLDLVSPEYQKAPGLSDGTK
jgi:8-oxo-dGTP pyrophosphatase MutT (NUDIX family)